MRVVALLLYLFLSAELARADTLRFAVEPFCPYGCVNAERTAVEAEMPGYLVEIVTAVFSDLGYTLRFDPMPFSRAVQAVRLGEVDGMIGMLKSDAPDLKFGEQPTGVAQACFLVQAGDPWRYEGPDSLRGRNFGGVAGYTYGILKDYLTDYPSRGRVLLLSGEDALERNLQLLQRGRIDVTVNDLNRIRYLLNRTEQQSLFDFAGCVDQPLWIFVPFSPARGESERLVVQLDKGLAELRRSGQLATILARYKINDWQ